jgi:alpha/beta superfamily hydrolase
MAEGKRLSQRFEDFQPSKTALFWSCAGCVVSTMIVGFTWGGWVTGGTAQEMAADALEQGRAEVAAAVCVEQFMAGTDARTPLASLKETRSSWQRENFIEDGGWAMVAGQEYDEAAELCAERLIEMEAPPAQEAATTDTGTVAQ